MSKIRRQDFKTALTGKQLDVQKAEQDPRLQGVNLRAADLDNDGKINGPAEVDKLFLEIDNFDRDGSYGSVALETNGNPTPVKEKMEGVCDAVGIRIAALTQTQAPTPPAAITPQAVADAAVELCTTSANNYGVDDPWINTDPGHNARVGVRYGGLVGAWKCNLFGGNAMAKAGFKPPHLHNKWPKDEYPNANLWYKFSDVYGPQTGNQVHFDMRGEVPVSQLSRSQAQKALGEMLAKAKPGDIIIADHMGSATADGGHVRVVVENHMNPDGTGFVKCAQASRSQAEVQDERLSEFTGEESVWVLTPNRPA